MAGPRRASALTGLLAGLALSGCGGLSAGPASPLPDHQQALDEFAAVYAPPRVAECLGLPVPQQRTCRDTISYALMTAIDLRYASFEADFFDKTRYGSFAGKVAQLGLSGAASVVAPLATANILAAIATGVGGAQEAFGRDILVERTSTALMTAMRAERARLVLRIRAGLQSRPEDYPFGWALSDLYAYYRAGTLPGALTALTRAVGADAQQAQDNVTRQALTGMTAVVGTQGTGSVVRTDPGGARVLQPAEPSPVVPRASGVSTAPAAAALRAWVSAAGGSPVARRQQIACNARELGFGEVQVPSFLRDTTPGVEQQRAQVLDRLRAATPPCGGMD